MFHRKPRQHWKERTVICFWIGKVANAPLLQTCYTWVGPVSRYILVGFWCLQSVRNPTCSTSNWCPAIPTEEEKVIQMEILSAWSKLQKQLWWQKPSIKAQVDSVEMDKYQEGALWFKFNLRWARLSFFPRYFKERISFMGSLCVQNMHEINNFRIICFSSDVRKRIG